MYPYLIIIDGNRAAPTCLVMSRLPKEEITLLSEIPGRHRERMGETFRIFAACAMNTLIARVDRIRVFDRHRVSAIDPEEFRESVAALMRRIANETDGSKSRLQPAGHYPA